MINLNWWQQMDWKVEEAEFVAYTPLWENIWIILPHLVPIINFNWLDTQPFGLIYLLFLSKINKRPVQRVTYLAGGSHDFKLYWHRKPETDEWSSSDHLDQLVINHCPSFSFSIIIIILFHHQFFQQIMINKCKISTRDSYRLYYYLLYYSIVHD